jgi:hypothetical protein
MADIVEAPWAPDVVRWLNGYQAARRMHPFTCPRDHSGRGERVLIAEERGWRCPESGCDYAQTWAHSFMADPSWLENPR